MSGFNEVAGEASREKIIPNSTDQTRNLGILVDALPQLLELGSREDDLQCEEPVTVESAVTGTGTSSSSSLFELDEIVECSGDDWVGMADVTSARAPAHACRQARHDRYAMGTQKMGERGLRRLRGMVVDTALGG